MAKWHSRDGFNFYKLFNISSCSETFIEFLVFIHVYLLAAWLAVRELIFDLFNSDQKFLQEIREFHKKSNVALVTGADGTIGTEIVKLLLENGYQVIGLVQKVGIRLDNVRYYEVDFSSLENVREVVKTIGDKEIDLAIFTAGVMFATNKIQKSDISKPHEIPTKRRKKRLFVSLYGASREMSVHTFIEKFLAAYLRERPRGLGLLQIPTGISDERSGPLFPGLFIAGNKVNEKPQTIPDVSLPGQPAVFTGRSAFNPFTQAVSAVYTEDISDAWGAGYAVNGVNGLGLNVRKNYDAYADLPLNNNDGMYQPFISAAMAGGEYDLSKIIEVSGSLNLPLPGVNEMFDLDGRYMTKSGGRAIGNGAIEFPLTLSDPNERAPYTFKYVMWAADRHMHYGHVVPNVNLFVVGKDKIMERLSQNRLNPTMIG